MSAPASAAGAGRYVAIGDSIAGAGNSYVDRLAGSLGITDVQKLVSGDTAMQAVTSELSRAVALIDDPTDTTVLTLQIGGHDYLSGNCNGDWNRPTCDFADGLNALLAALSAALARDPGPERFLVVAYYNPASGLGGTEEPFFDVGLRGADGRLDTAAHGDDWGMTDVIAWLACRYGGTLVDPWVAFKAGGQSLMADTVHPNAAGQAVLTDLLEDPSAGGPQPACPGTTPFADTDPDAGDGLAHGVVEPRLTPVRWWFEYGPTNSYGRSTAVRELPASAGARAVRAALPASALGSTFHVRLFVENNLGQADGQDRVVTTPRRPKLTASLRGSRLRRRILSRGVRLRIASTGRLVTVRARLRRAGPDPLVLRARLPWTSRAARTVNVPLTSRGRRLVRRAIRPRIALTLTAAGPGGVSRPVRLTLKPR